MTRSSRRARSIPRSTKPRSASSSPRTGAAFLLAATLLVAMLAAGPIGCAGNRDRLEPFNRTMLRFNTGLDRRVIKPATDVYTFLVPKPIRGLVGNFFENLDTPRVVVHNLLQGKRRDAHDATGRFIANTIFGLGGLFDVATPMGLEHQDEDLGQTLAVWGVKPGTYIVLPLFGPSTLRDGLDIPFQIVTNPFFYAETPLRLSTSITRGLNQRADAQRQLQALDDASVDRYTFLREAYLQRRRFLISDGELSEESIEDLDPVGDEYQPLDEDLDLLDPSQDEHTPEIQAAPDRPSDEEPDEDQRDPDQPDPAEPPARNPAGR